MKKMFFICILILAAGCGGGGSGGTTTNNSSPPVIIEAKYATSTGELSNHAISVAGMARQYSLFRPNNPSRKKLPLVIWFHGAGGVVWPGIKDDYWVNVAGRESFYLLEPQAVSDIYAPYTYWNAGLGAPKDDVLFVTTVLNSVLAQEDIDTDRIYEGGMSRGGHMAFYTAQALRDRLAAIAPIAGSISTSPDVLAGYTLLKPMPMCHFQGTADTIVNINGGDWYASWANIRSLWLNNNGIGNPPTVNELPDFDTTDGSTVTKFEYRGATIASDIDDYRINGGNHSVPGIESHANQDINAYEVIWAFFKKHKLSDPY